MNKVSHFFSQNDAKQISKTLMYFFFLINEGVEALWPRTLS